MRFDAKTRMLGLSFIVLLFVAPLAEAGVPGTSTLGLAGVDVAVLALDQAPAESAEPSTGFWSSFRRVLWLFLLLSLFALVALVVTILFLLWRAKRMVENALEADIPKLERTVAKLRAAHPELDDDGLAKKIIHRQANRCGLVGLVTGIGGLPALPIAIPIDIAASVKLQSNLVHMLRMVRGEQHTAEEVSQASLWLITTGGQELTAASSTLIRDLLVKTLSKSVLKFLPILGGVIGFALNWGSTQALGRLTLKWLRREPEAAVQASDGVVEVEPVEESSQAESAAPETDSSPPPSA